MKKVLENALASLQFADSEIVIEPYEHCSGEAVDAHYLLRKTIEDLKQLIGTIETNDDSVSFH